MFAAASPEKQQAGSYAEPACRNNARLYTSPGTEHKTSPSPAGLFMLKREPAETIPTGAILHVLVNNTMKLFFIAKTYNGLHRLPIFKEDQRRNAHDPIAGSCIRILIDIDL